MNTSIKTKTKTRVRTKVPRRSNPQLLEALQNTNMGWGCIAGPARSHAIEYNLADILLVAPLDLVALNQKLTSDIQKYMALKGHNAGQESVCWEIRGWAGVVERPGWMPVLVGTECKHVMAEPVENSRHEQVVCFKGIEVYRVGAAAGGTESANAVVAGAAIPALLRANLPLNNVLPFKKPQVSLKDLLGEPGEVAKKNLKALVQLLELDKEPQKQP